MGKKWERICIRGYLMKVARRPCCSAGSLDCGRCDELMMASHETYANRSRHRPPPPNAHREASARLGLLGVVQLIDESGPPFVDEADEIAVQVPRRSETRWSDSTGRQAPGGSDS